MRRFTPAHSAYANVQLFDNITFKPGDSAEQQMSQIRLSAARINYAEAQICNKFLGSLPKPCHRAVVMVMTENATSDQLVAITQKYLDTSSSDPATSEVAFLTQTSEPSTDHRIASLEAKIHSLSLKNNNQERKPRDRYNNQERKPRDRSGSVQSRSSPRHRPPRMLCNYCNKPNHKWRECRQRLFDTAN